MKKALNQVLAASLFMAASLSHADTMPKSLAETAKVVDHAIVKLDFKAFSSVFDPSYVQVDPMGKVGSRAEFLGMIQQVFQMSKSAKQTTTIRNVVVSGDYVEVAYSLTAEFVIKEGKVKVSEVGTDSWHKVNGKWLIYRTVQDKFSMTGP